MPRSGVGVMTPSPYACVSHLRAYERLRVRLLAQETLSRARPAYARGGARRGLWLPGSQRSGEDDHTQAAHAARVSDLGSGRAAWATDRRSISQAPDRISPGTALLL